MSKRGLIGILVAATLLVVAGTVWGARVTPPPTTVKVHELSCDQCHGGGVTLVGTTVTEMANNLCLQCHSDTPTGTTTTLGNNGPARTVTTRLNPHDASDAMGTLSASGWTPSEQTSHNFANQNVIVPAAGATSAPSFYTGSATVGKLACSVCHDPHLDLDAANPDILRTSNVNDALCLDCHVGFDAAITVDPVTHPVNVVMPGSSSATASSVTDPDGNVALVGSVVSCSSCHRTHGADSDRSTADGISDAARAGGPLNPGDGKLLVTDGANAADPSYLCQTCHVYMKHGPGDLVNCLDCHGGHPDPAAPSPNINMLRYQTTSYNRLGGSLSASEELVTGLTYTSATDPWKNAGTGYCEACHTLPLGVHYNGATDGDGAAKCTECHQHGGAKSFAGCAGCHGTPPTTSTDFANDGTYNYSTSGLYKDESATPHAGHAAGSGNHSFACSECHGPGAGTNANHQTGTFQDVPFDTLADTGTFNATFVGGAANSTCSSVYCHSNGNGGAPITTGLNWNASNLDFACADCHGNTTATMTSASNSSSHGLHLTKYTNNCAICHKSTATSNAALVQVNGAATPVHVNASKDVLFDTTFNLGVKTLVASGSYPVDGCTVYCHSNGKGVYNAPDWAAGTGGACGDCHQAVSTTDTGAVLGDAHAKHVIAPGSLGLACDTCHTNAGSGADHINGEVSLKANYMDNVCNVCHGATNGLDDPTDVDPDRQPYWTRASSVDCYTCHTGSAIGNFSSFGSFRAAPSKADFTSYGHGAPGLTSAPGCTGCHTPNSNHFDNAADDNMLTGGVAANNAFCQTCHAQNAHFNDSLTADGTSFSGDNCATCHEPHGDGTIRPATVNANAMLNAIINAKPVVNYDKSNGKADTDFVVASPNPNYGICQVCHDPAEVGHYNTTTNDSHNSGQVCTSCHSHTSTPSAFPGGDCFGCHGNGSDSYWPDTAGTNIRGGTNNSDYDDDGAHTLHMTVIAAREGFVLPGTDAQQKAACAYCHVIGDGDHGTKAVGSHAEVFPSGGTSLWGAADGDAAFDNTLGQYTCSNIDCHNGKPTTTSYNWYGTPGASECVMCHNDIEVTTAGTTGATHVAHLTQSATYGRAIACADCHDSAAAWDSAGPTYTAPANNHIDGTLNVAGAKVVSDEYTGTYTDFDTRTSGSCSGGSAVNSCHNDGTGAGTPASAYTWTAALNGAACNICHAASPSSNEHGTHLGSNTYVPADCADCHAAANTTTHLNGSPTLGGNAVVSGAPSCTSSCHTLKGADNTASTGDDASWTAGVGLGCEDCHGSGSPWSPGGNNLDRGWPPAQGEHALHVGNGYISANCVDCHNNNTVTHSVLNGSVTTPIGKITAFTSPDCTNTCHSTNGVDNTASTADDADWTAGAGLGCVDCHDNAKIGLKANLAPTSGLHATTSAMAHDVSFDTDKTCTSCHATTPTDQHLNTAGPTAWGAGGISYTFAANIDSYNANGCAAKCHFDNNATVADAGKWQRKWNGVVDAKPLATDSPGAAVCDNCHGDGLSNATTLDGVWRNGLTFAHEANWDGDAFDNEVLSPLSNHSTCQGCHGWGNANYDETWGTGEHGNGQLEMNGPDAPLAGAGYSQADWGCAAACHTGSYTNGSGDPNENHVLADTGWPIGFGDYGSGDCDTCHASNGRTHSGGNKSLDTHNLHTTSNYISGTGCTACHPHDGISVPPGTGIHATNSTVDFNGVQMPTTSEYGVNFLTNCTTNTCHDTDGISEWANTSLNDVGGDACADCHDSGKTAVFTTPTLSGSTPTSGEHAAHLGNTALITQCSECHGHNGTLSAVAPFTNHIDKSIAIGDQLTTYTNPGCTNSCHNLAGDPGAADWSAANTNSLSCADCHNKASNTIGTPIYATLTASVPPTTGKHVEHMTASGSYIVNGCTACHNHSGALGSFGTTGHANGSISYVGTLSYASQSCTNACHVVTSAADDGWVNDARTLECTDCHINGGTLGAAGSAGMSATVAPSTGKHDRHMANNTYVPNNCTDCHGHSGELGDYANTGHVNGPNSAVISVAGEITVSPIPADDTCTNNCHLVVDGRDWTAGTLNCADCHNAATKTLNQGGWPAASNSHSEHLASNALPSAAQSDCYACHDATITNAGALKATAFSHADGTVALGFNSAFNYEAGTASRDNKTTPANPADDTCSAVQCHNGATTPAWGVGTSGTAGDIACGDCHGTKLVGPLPVGTTAGSHTKHANNDGDFTDCAGCHGTIGAYSASGGSANHQNLTVNMIFSTTVDPDANNLYTDADGKAGVNYAGTDFTDDGTCNSVLCHFDNTTPPWGSTGSTTCTSCHNNGTDNGVLTNAYPDSGWHQRHVQVADADYINVCEDCHGANDGSHAGHGQLNGPNFSTGADPSANVVWNTTNNTCTNDCHVASNGDWDETLVQASQAGSLVCNDCHNGTLKDLYVSGALDASTPPATGKHTIHDSNSLTILGGGACTTCHPHSGALGNPGTTKHVDGGSTGLSSNVDLANQITAPAETLAAWTQTCTNNCHVVTSQADDGWVNDARTLECADCHSTGMVGAFATGQHSVHNQTFPAAYTTAVAPNVDSIAYDYNCANCHDNSAGANHMNNTAEVKAAVNYSSGNCSNNACHTDGVGGAAAVVANWTSGWVSDPTTNDTCDNCHGNSPSSGAHAVHVVGIHYADIYTGTSGLISKSGNTAPTGHGDGLNTTINCNICHNSTVTTFANDQNPSCSTASCHTQGAANQGNIGITDKSVHVDGSKTVSFITMTNMETVSAPFKSKAQLRDNLADASLDTVWTRSGSYKAASGYDAAAGNADAYETNGSQTCSNIACHNGIEVVWGTPASDCSVCHTSLPK